MLSNNTVQTIADNALCTGCGGCSCVCPVGAISMIINTAGYISINVERKKCINCAKCYDICPSNSDNSPNCSNCDPFHGNYLSGFIGYAADPIIRQKSQSGGVVTALLCYLLEKDLIDGAIINRFDKEIRRPEVTLASSREAIVEGKGSYYSQSTVVKVALEHQELRTVAVTLGCQSECIKNIRLKHPEIKLPTYNFGLICAGQYSGSYIDELIKKAGCSEKGITGFRFKDKDAGGWPGNIKIYTDEGEFVVEEKIRHRLKPVYELYRCILCYNQMNIYSDITFGDPWGINDKSNEKGNTVLIVRTKKGQKLIEDAIKADVIQVDELPVKKIMEGQTVNGRLKSQYFTAIQICQGENYAVPYDHTYFENITYKNPSVKKYKEINKRIKYGRKLFLEERPERVKQLIKAKQREIIVKKTILMFIKGVKKLKTTLKNLK